MKFVKSIIIILLTIGCSKDKTVEEKDCCFVLDTNIRLNLLTADGEDLLNSETEGYYPVEDMKLYYEINGEITEVFDPNMGAPRNISLITETTPYQLNVGTYSGDEGLTSEENGIKKGFSMAYLELNEFDTDTIKTEWEAKATKYFVDTEVWYNGVLQESPDVVFEVVK